MIWHGFGMYGMGGASTDPAEAGFSQRVKALGVDIHGSPYNDYDAGSIAGIINKLPSDDGVFVWGTSLGSNNTPAVCSYTKHRIDGAFGFQASQYGARVPLTENVQFAHLIWSLSPIPFPGLGSYIWEVGTMNPASYHKTRKDLPHPGDYDPASQDLFLAEMKRIMGAVS